MRFQIFFYALLALLWGCTTTAPQGDAHGSVELAVSRQETSDPGRQRAKVHTELGRLYLSNAHHEVALNEARIALDSDSSYAPAYSLRGLIYMALRKNDFAEDNFRQALGLARGDPEINNDYGWFLCQNGRAGESISHFQVAINNRLYSDPGKALANAGRCAVIAKNDVQAEAFLTRAMSTDRSSAIAALYWLSDIYYRSSRYPEAQRRMKELHNLIEPTAESAWLGLRIDRKLNDREGEARYTGIMRRKYRETMEYQKMLRGEFD
jgi:type IV pilus assembly protein PilF